MFEKVHKILTVLLVAVLVYDTGAFFYLSFTDYIYYSAIPTFIFLIITYTIYRVLLKNTVKNLSSEFIVLSGGDYKEATSALEKDIEKQKETAINNPSKMPEFLKKLIALYFLYKEKDKEKASFYASEIRTIINSDRYPQDEDAIKTKQLAEKVLNSK